MADTNVAPERGIVRSKSDQLFGALAAGGVRYCASVSGGGIMFLVDAAARCADIRTRFFHHEQAAAFAAEAHARARGAPAVCLVTIGPGVANAVAGAFSCYLNSVPCVFVSGAKRSNIVTNYKTQRFTFPQDADTRSLARGTVKRIIELKPTDDIGRIVAGALKLATAGRPGPVWISVPLDVQGMAAAAERPKSAVRANRPRRDIGGVVEEFLRGIRKPLFMVGRGAEAVMREAPYRAFLADCGLPFVTSIGSNHTIAAAGANGLGFFGPTGRRAANQILHEADGLIAIGAGLDIDNTGFDRERFFAGKAVLAVNSDPDLDLGKDCANFTRVTMDLRDIDFERLRARVIGTCERFAPWRAFVVQVASLLTVEWEVENNLGSAAVDPYLLALELARRLPPRVGIAGGISLDVLALSHAASLAVGQDFYISSHCGQLGWDIPAAVGLCDSGLYDHVVCITGDGSVMFNLQELATLSSCPQNVTLFILDNLGYNSIRTSQDIHLNGRRTGSDLTHLTFPRWPTVAQAFGFEFDEILENRDITGRLARVMRPGKRLVRVAVDPERSRTPRLVSRISEGKFQSPGLEDQFPILVDEPARRLAAFRAELARQLAVPC
jgi:acetolactate synthase-1/2/3 large subunit